MNVLSNPTKLYSNQALVWSCKDGEEHLFNPKTIDLLQESLINGDYAKYKEYSKAIRNDYHVTLRSLMELNYPVGGGIPIEEVEG